MFLWVYYGGFSLENRKNKKLVSRLLHLHSPLRIFLQVLLQILLQMLAVLPVARQLPRRHFLLSQQLCNSDHTIAAATTALQPKGVPRQNDSSSHSFRGTQ